MTAHIEPPEGFRTSGVEPTGTRLLLIRHGEAHCNVQGVMGGPKGCGGLTEHGREQARALRDRLVHSRELAKASAIYTSILPRSIETAEIIAPGLADVMPVQDCDLCELHAGEADGLTWDEVIERYGLPDWDVDPTLVLAPGGESWLDFYERCRVAFERLVTRHEGELVVLVVHGGVVEQAMKIMQGLAPKARMRLRTENCSMTEIEFSERAMRLLRYNDRAPLAPA